MQSLLSRHLAAPTGLPINCHHRAFRQGRQHTADPVPETLLHGTSIQQAKQPAKCVVRGYSASELHKSPQPADAFIGPCFDANEVVNPTEQRADRHHQHLHQVVLRPSRYTRIRQPRKGFRQRQPLARNILLLLSP